MQDIPFFLAAEFGGQVEMTLTQQSIDPVSTSLTVKVFFLFFKS